MDERQIENLCFYLLGNHLHQVLRCLLQEHRVVSLPGDIDIDVVHYRRDPRKDRIAVPS